MSPWQPPVVGLIIGLYVNLTEANRICPGSLLERLGERHTPSIRVDVETWRSWDPSWHHEGRGCLRVKPPQRTEDGAIETNWFLIVFEHLDGAMPEAFKPWDFYSSWANKFSILPKSVWVGFLPLAPEQSSLILEYSQATVERMNQSLWKRGLRTCISNSFSEDSCALKFQIHQCGEMRTELGVRLRFWSWFWHWLIIWRWVSHFPTLSLIFFPVKQKALVSQAWPEFLCDGDVKGFLKRLRIHMFLTSVVQDQAVRAEVAPLAPI